MTFVNFLAIDADAVTGTTSRRWPETPRHRADAATETTSRRWRGAPKVDFHTDGRNRDVRVRLRGAHDEAANTAESVDAHADRHGVFLWPARRQRLVWLRGIRWRRGRLWRSLFASRRRTVCYCKIGGAAVLAREVRRARPASAHECKTQGPALGGNFSPLRCQRDGTSSAVALGVTQIC